MCSDAPGIYLRKWWLKPSVRISMQNPFNDLVPVKFKRKQSKLTKKKSFRCSTMYL